MIRGGMLILYLFSFFFVSLFRYHEPYDALI